MTSREAASSWIVTGWDRGDGIADGYHPPDTLAPGEPIPTKRFAYDSAVRLASVSLPAAVDPLTGLKQRRDYEYGYDPFGNQTLIRDPRRLCN